MAQKKNRNKLLKKVRIRRIILITLLCLVCAAAVGVGVYYLVTRAVLHTDTRYLASTHATADVYYYDDYEKRLFKTTSDMIRGTEVIITGEQYTENGRTYEVVKYGGE